MKLLPVAALLAVTALPAAAKECGVQNTQLAAPFAGHWLHKNGDSYDLAPGKMGRTFKLHTGVGTETNHEEFHFVAKHVGEDDEMSSLLDCRDLTAKERDSIEGMLIALADAAAVRGSDEDRQNRQDIARFRSSLAQPPYRMLAASHYEDQQWVILLSPNRLLDVWFGEGMFSVNLYERKLKK